MDNPATMTEYELRVTQQKLKNEIESERRMEVERLQNEQYQKGLAQRQFDARLRGDLPALPQVDRLMQQREEATRSIQALEQQQREVEVSANQAWAESKTLVSLEERAAARQAREMAKLEYKRLETQAAVLKKTIEGIDESLRHLGDEHHSALYRRELREVEWEKVASHEWSDSKERTAQDLINALMQLYYIEEKEELRAEAEALKKRLQDESPWWIADQAYYSLADGRVVNDVELQEWALKAGSSNGVRCFCGKGSRIKKEEAKKLGLWRLGPWMDADT